MNPKGPPARRTCERPAIDLPRLAQRVEEASLDAWPTLHQRLHDGWLLRFAGGFTKRANSVVPLHPSRYPIERKIDYCERRYAARRLRPVFRLTTLDDHAAIDEALAQRGYRRVEPTQVLWRPLQDASEELPGEPPSEPRSRGHGTGASAAADGPRLARRGRKAWLAIYAELAGMPRRSQALHEALLGRVSLPCIHLVLSEQGRPIGCGRGVLDAGLIGMFDILTELSHRRMGHGSRILSALLARGRAAGASAAYLQVLQENLPALRLYERFGFRPLYRYWYRSTA